MRAVSAALVIALGLALLVETGADASVAEAASARPKLTLVAGDRTITAAWAPLSGVRSYELRVATTKAPSTVRVIRTRVTTVKIGRLTSGRLQNGTRYAVTVAAVRTGGSGATSRAVATPAAGVPTPVSNVTTRSGPGVDQVTVTWAGGGRAVRVAVMAGSSTLTNVRTFHSPWRPATTRSVVLTVPAAYRPYIGAGSGNPVWVRVAQSNGTSSFFSANSASRRYALSAPGTWAFAKAAPAKGAVDRLTVGEYNVQSVGSTKTFSTSNQWAARAARVAAAINTTAPKLDLLLTAELATNKLDDCVGSKASPYTCRDHTQVADLARRLPGLRLADADAFDRVHDRMSLDGYWGSRVTSGAHVFYDPEKLELLDHGFYSPAMSRSDTSIPGVEGLGVTPWDPTGPVSADRWLSWARLRVVASGREFYAVAAHFPVGDQPVVVAARALETTRLIAAIEKRAGDLPIVFGGDVNSDATRSPDAVTPRFIRAGWFDAAAVSAKSLRTGMKVSTSNGSGPQDGADPGYGSRPNVHPYETSRIDYILLKNSPHTYRYANVLRVDGTGRFIRSLQGSDHNMQVATIGIGDPVPAS